MNDEKLICEICGREVNDREYITSTEGDVICKCCGFDWLEESFVALIHTMHHLRDVLEAAGPVTAAMKDALEVLPEEVLEQIKEYSDADDTETEA